MGLEPADAKVAAANGVRGKFTLQYSAAAMVVHGQVGVAGVQGGGDREREVLDLARRVRYELQRISDVPAGASGGARVRTTDGACSRRSFRPAGSAGEPVERRSGPREVPRQRVARARRRRGRVLEGAISSLERESDLRAMLALSPPREIAVYDDAA